MISKEPIKKVDLATLENICHDITSISKEVSNSIAYTNVSLTTFAKVMGLLSQPVLISDADRAILYVNQAFTDVLGYTSEEILGRKPDFLFGSAGDLDYIVFKKEDLDYLRDIKEKLKTGKQLRRKIKFYKKDGTPIKFYSHIIPVVDNNGVMYRRISVFYELNADGQIDVSDQG